MSPTGVQVLPAERVRVYHGWVVLGMAALAMVGTLPGRTQGLGLITEPLLRDISLSRIGYAQINLVATLIGALFCIGVGRLIDRCGSRVVLTVIALSSASSSRMSQAAGFAALLAFVTLTRALGQSALSVVSLAMVGKWFRRQLTKAMGVYALAMSIGFMLAFPAVGAVVLSQGWRVAWAAVGIALLLVLAPVAWLFDRSCCRNRWGSKSTARRLASTRCGRSPRPGRCARRCRHRRSGSSHSRAPLYGLVALRHRPVQRIHPG